jgi:hypothetical protein
MGRRVCGVRKAYPGEPWKRNVKVLLRTPAAATAVPAVAQRQDRGSFFLVHGTAPAKTRRLPWPVADPSPACRRGLVPMPAGRWPCRAYAAGTVPICTCTQVPARSRAPGGGCGAAAGAAATSGWSRPTTPLAPGRRAFRATSAGSPGGRSAVRLAARTRADLTLGPRLVRGVLTPSMRTIGNEVNDGHLRRWPGQRRRSEIGESQAGCCTWCCTASLRLPGR